MHVWRHATAKLPFAENLWTLQDEPFAFLSNFQPYPESLELSSHPMRRVGFNQMLLNQQWLVYKGLFLKKDLKSFGALRLQVNMQDGDNSTTRKIFIAIHMAPKYEHETAQPFASSDDSSALLESGRSYEIVAKVAAYRRVQGRKRRCTNSLSLSSWQVQFHTCRIFLRLLFMHLLQTYKDLFFSS